MPTKCGTPPILTVRYSWPSKKNGTVVKGCVIDGIILYGFDEALGPRSNTV
jgi:hypothetical protein